MKRERAALEAARPSKVETLACIDRLVDEHSERWARKHAGSFASALAGGTDYQGTRAMPRAPRLPSFGALESPLKIWDWVALDPEKAKAALRRVVDGATFGPSTAEKVKRLADLDAAIAEAERERDELQRSIEAAGLDIPATAELKAKREREQEIGDLVPGGIHGEVGGGPAA